MNTSLTIHGYAGSTFVRTVRMTCAEKGVPYDLVPPASAGDPASHPFGRMPTMRHGNLTLFESLAIATYIDATFPGKTLQPRDPEGRAHMLQWVSAVNDYLYQPAVRQYAVPLNKGERTAADLTSLADDIGQRLAVLDDAVAKGAYLGGTEPSLADLFAVPMLAYLDGVESGAAMIDTRTNLRAYLDTWADRPSFQATR